LNSLDELPSIRTFQPQIIDLTLVYNDNDGIVNVLKDYTINAYAHILTFFKNIRHLSIHGSSIAAYPGLSLCGLPSTTFSSSTLSKLCINASTFDDCLYLLDGRLQNLNELIVRIYDINAPSLIDHNKVSEDYRRQILFFNISFLGQTTQFKMFFINMS
jgi:hypothetical protein